MKHRLLLLLLLQLHLILLLLHQLLLLLLLHQLLLLLLLHQLLLLLLLHQLLLLLRHSCMRIVPCCTNRHQRGEIRCCKAKLLLLLLLLRHEVLLGTGLHASGEQRFSCSIVSSANVPRSLSLYILRRHVGPRLQQQPDNGR